MAQTLRQYTPSDRASVCSVWFRSAKDEYTYLDSWRTLTEVQAANIFDEFIVDRCNIWVAEDDKIAGFLAMDDSYVARLYVDPSRQRAGWGSLLLAKAKALYPRGLELHTHQQNQRARNFYEKHGFQAVKFGISPPPDPAPDVEYHWRPQVVTQQLARATRT
jgi:ribosomal protein S18 acetylase RimI-like enzyme